MAWLKPRCYRYDAFFLQNNLRSCWICISSPADLHSPLQAGDSSPAAEAVAPAAQPAAAPAAFFGGGASSGAGAGAGAAAGGSFGGSDEPSPLVEFNKRFREACEAKDAAERDAKTARRAAGKAALKSLNEERNKAIATRKASNRGEEAAKARSEKEGMAGEPWQRVFSLVDVHKEGGAGGAGAGAEEGAAGGAGRKKGKEHAVDAATDTSRMKDVLIAVKNTPPPAATA